MAHQLIITSSRHNSRSFPKRTLPRTFQVGTFFLFFTMTILIGFMSLLYLRNFTEIYTKSSDVRKLEIEQNKLRTTNEQKYTNLTKIRSLSHIRESATVSAMVPMKKPMYVGGEGGLARND